MQNIFSCYLDSISLSFYVFSNSTMTRKPKTTLRPLFGKILAMWLMPIIPELRRQKQGNHEFQLHSEFDTTLRCKAIPRLIKQNSKTKQIKHLGARSTNSQSCNNLRNQLLNCNPKQQINSHESMLIKIIEQEINGEEVSCAENPQVIYVDIVLLWGVGRNFLLLR